MNNWLKLILSVGTGFATGAITAKQSGAGRKGILLGGAITALLGVGNLIATPPPEVEKAKDKVLLSSVEKL